jgi:hypothetical protein
MTSRIRRSPESGGLGRAAQVFGDDLGPLLDELNEALVV